MDSEVFDVILTDDVYGMGDLSDVIRLRVKDRDDLETLIRIIDRQCDVVVKGQVVIKGQGE